MFFMLLSMDQIRNGTDRSFKNRNQSFLSTNDLLLVQKDNTKRICSQVLFSIYSSWSVSSLKNIKKYINLGSSHSDRKLFLKLVH